MQNGKFQSKAKIRLAFSSLSLQSTCPQGAHGSHATFNLLTKTMRNYEAIIVFNMKGTESTVEELTNAVVSDLKEEGAQITSIDNLGRKEFAYESHHIKAGQYVVITFSAEPSAIKTMRERVRLNTLVHLQYYKLVG